MIAIDGRRATVAGRNDRQTIAKRRLTAIAFAVLVLGLIVGVATALAGKSAETTFGGPGTTGGLFDFGGGGSADVAVHQSTGQIYVADRNNRRVQRFDSELNFELAFGRDVIEAGAAGDLGDAFEVCTVAADCQAGSEGTFEDAPGGEFRASSRLAIDQSNGDLYATDANNRIVKFMLDDNGTPAEPADDRPVFDRAFGWDVVQPGGSGEVKGNERQQVILGVPFPVVSGSFTLTFGGETTGPIAFDASAAAMQSALEALPNVAPGDVAVSGSGGSPWSVDFAGAYAGLDLAEMTVTSVDLKGTPANNFTWSSDVKTPISGAGFEICTVASQCKRGGGGSDHRDGGVAIGGALAVHPTTGELFFADTENGRVQQFEADGDFVRAWGWGVDTGADEFEICTAASLCEEAIPTSSSNTQPHSLPPNGQFLNSPDEGDQPTQIAVDSQGIVYASNGDNSGPEHAPRVERFDSNASSAAQLLLPDPIGTADPSPGFPAGPLPDGTARAFEIDPGTDHLYYMDSFAVIAEIDATPAAAAPSLVDTHLEDAENVFVSGLGYDDASDRLYVSASHLNSPFAPIQRVVVVGNNGAPPAVVVLDPPSGIGAHGATFSGEVTPDGPPSIETSYRFEYREVGAASWLSVPSTPVNLGDGNSPVPVEQSVADLEACTDHEVRLVAVKSFGAGITTSEPQQFETTCIPPDLKTLFPQRLTDTEATLAGDLNPNNLPTTYRFEYLTEAEFQANGYANAVSVPTPDGEADGGAFAKVASDIEGLTPLTGYRYRFRATNAQGTTVGEDVTFTTKATPSSEAPVRGFEMVTPPFKVVRAAVWPNKPPGNNPNVGIPTLSGETIAWKAPYFPLTDEVGSPGDGDKRLLRRHPQLGWVNETLNTLKLASGSPLLVGQSILAASADFETQPTDIEAGEILPQTGGLLPTEGGIANRYYTFRKGTGIEGYTPWLTNPEEQFAGALDEYSVPDELALVDDAGTAMLRWDRYRGLGEDPNTPGDDDPSDDETVTGSMVYLQRAADPDALPTALKELVNACTGAGATATLVPSLTAGEAIATRECPTKTSTKLTSALGAGLAGGSGPFTGAPQATALSDGGDRIFFLSPDPAIAPQTCKPGATGTFTSCPPQLYVRQYDSEGNATVRWISRAQGIVGAQKATEMGRGIVFEGASRDGRYVYFKTNSPLLPTDPNGGVSITGGSASDKSWDLYRYELPAGLDEDPANGTLTRVSGGLDGTADPSTNQVEFGTDPAGTGAPLRFLSDDGHRAYFLTTSPLEGADETAPEGGSTTPGGAVGNGATRNLYLFDENAEGADRYRFVARIPYALGSLSPLETLNACASGPGAIGAHTGPGWGGPNVGGQNCFRGTPDGSHVAFFSGAQLTADDNDAAGDIYLYDAEADELTRVSAPRAAVSPYRCTIEGSLGQPDGYCNADLGYATVLVAAGGGGLPPLETARGWAGGRYYNVARGKDGEVSVFFESRSELIAADTNGDHWDVYEWREGKLRLLSPGDSADHSYFSGNSLDGEDVFIWTSKRIDPREIDPADYDLYDARIGGGFPYTPPPIPCDVLALECEDEALPAPPTRAPDSAGFQGSGNVIEKPRKPRCRKGQVRRKGRCVNKRKPNRRRSAKGR